MFRRRHPFIGFGIVAMLAVDVLAQKPVNAAFDVVSIKVNRSGSPYGRIGPEPGGRFTMTNLPAARLVREAYPLPDTNLVNAPAWLLTDRFDVVAKASVE